LIYVTRKAHFNAAHRLHNPNKSDQWNQATYGKCNHPNWHGHNYLIEVTVGGSVDLETGYLIDLGKLQQIIEEVIIEPCDHKNLNLDVDFLKGVITSTENLAEIFFRRLKVPVETAAAEGGQLISVKLFETERNSAEFRI